MNFKGISYYLSLFCFPISILAFINILYSSYFDYFLSINSYLITLIVSFVIGSSLLFIGKKSEKKINFIEQLLLIILVYLLISLFIALPFYIQYSSQNPIYFGKYSLKFLIVILFYICLLILSSIFFISSFRKKSID